MRHLMLLTPSVALALLSGCGGINGSANGRASDPGRVTMHRLNRTEYNNTVRDLLLSELSPADDFPDDDFGNGFDNQADVLSLSPLHIEMYELAADQLIDELLAFQVESSIVRLEAETGDATTGGASGEYWNLWSNGSVSESFLLLSDGDYIVRTRVAGQQAGPDPVSMSLGVDEFQLQTFDVTETSNAPGIYEVVTPIDAGMHTATVWFNNDYYEPGVADRNLLVDWMEIEGPLDSNGERSPGYDEVFTCTGEAMSERSCAEQIAREFGGKAWRRPLTQPEIDRLVGLYDLSVSMDGAFEESVGFLLKGILMSPHFIFRVEVDDDPESPEARPLNDYELASRLSYFLWSSTPDDELLALAAEGELQDDEVLAGQVDRMLADSKAAALVDGLATQWLYIRAIDEAWPDPVVFPEFDDALRASMREEMRQFVGPFFVEDRPMTELVTARDTVIDDRLAQHYGWEPVSGGWVSVEPSDVPRAGLLTQGGLLTALSYPTRTSPVRRGAWVLSNLMCEAPPPPPAGVEAIMEEEGASETQSLREQMEQHRADPVCASCHNAMDPIGFSLESFDGVGVYRDFDDHGNPVDASGQLPDGFTFAGAEELGHHLASDPRLPRCIAQKTFTYALGRAPLVEDLEYLDAIQLDFTTSQHTFSGLAKAIVLSDPFRYKRGEPATEEGQ